MLFCLSVLGQGAGAPGWQVLLHERSSALAEAVCPVTTSAAPLNPSLPLIGLGPPLLPLLFPFLLPFPPPPHPPPHTLTHAAGYLPFDDARNPEAPALSVIWKGILTEEPSFRWGLFPILFFLGVGGGVGWHVCSLRHPGRACLPKSPASGERPPLGALHVHARAHVFAAGFSRHELHGCMTCLHACLDCIPAWTSRARCACIQGPCVRCACARHPRCAVCAVLCSVGAARGRRSRTRPRTLSRRCSQR